MVVLLVGLLGVVAPAPAGAATPGWAKGAVRYLKDAHLLDNTFAPNKAMRRNDFRSLMDGAFGGGYHRTKGKVTAAEVDRALVKALGQAPVAEHLENLTSPDDWSPKVRKWFGDEIVAREMGLRHDRPVDEDEHEASADERMTQADIAYAVWRALTGPSTYGADALTGVALPKVGDAQASGPRVRVLSGWDPLRLCRRVDRRHPQRLSVWCPEAWWCRLLGIRLVRPPEEDSLLLATRSSLQGVVVTGTVLGRDGEGDGRTARVWQDQAGGRPAVRSFREGLETSRRLPRGSLRRPRVDDPLVGRARRCEHVADRQGQLVADPVPLRSPGYRLINLVRRPGLQPGFARRTIESRTSGSERSRGSPDRSARTGSRGSRTRPRSSSATTARPAG